MSADTDEGRAAEEADLSEALDAAADYIAQFLVNPDLRVNPRQIAATVMGMKPPLCPWDCDHCRE